MVREETDFKERRRVILINPSLLFFFPTTKMYVKVKYNHLIRLKKKKNQFLKI